MLCLSKYNSREQGFTLIELMITIVIIAILASIAVPSYRKYVRQNAEEQAQQHALMVADQLNRWRAKTLSYQSAIGAKGSCADEVKRCFSESTSTDANGDIYVPRDSTKDTYRYKINVNVQSNRWRMLVTPNQKDGLVKSSDAYYLDSLGQRCRYKSGTTLPVLTATTIGCTGTGVSNW